MAIGDGDIDHYTNLYDDGKFNAVSENRVEFDEINGGVGKVTADIEYGSLTNFRIEDPLGVGVDDY